MENQARNARAADVNDDFAAASFSRLPMDCKVHIASFLPEDDRNNLAECNSECNEARNNESLDQQRTGTIVWKSNTLQSLCRKLSQVQPVFTGNRTHMKIVMYEQACSMFDFTNREADRIMGGVRFQQVTTLTMDLTITASPSSGHITMELFLYPLSGCLQNLLELYLDCQNVKFGFFEGNGIRRFLSSCPALFKVTAPGYLGYQCGKNLEEATNLTELYADNVVFSCTVFDANVMFEQVLASDRPEFYLLMKCHRLERLSIKGATVKPLLVFQEPYPLSQETLINMVRHHPTLRWLKSDLTPENVALLKEERPDITFVSE